MTLSTTDSRFVYDGDGTTTAFSFPRKVIEAAHIDVYVYDEDDDSMSLQTLNTHYTFAGSGLANGIYASATITFLSAPGSDKKVILYRDPTLTNEFDFTSETNVLNALNRYSDRVEMKLQRLQDQIGRTFRLSDGDYRTSFAALTALGGKAGYIPQVNDDEDGIEWVLNDGSSTSVTPTGGSTSRTLAAWLADAAIMFATYAEMTAATYLVDNAVYGTYGRTAEEDGGFGIWRYDSASTATADGGSILAIDGGGAGRFFRLHDGIARPEWFGSSSAWGAAITAAAVNFNYVRFTPGVTYTWSDSQVVIDKGGFVLDCRGATLQPKYASDYAFKFGNGATTRTHIKILGGLWNQRPVSDGGVAQGLWDLRGVNQLYTIGCYGQNIYQIARWGLPADSQDSYQWWHEDCKWVMRTNANGGHSHAILADGSLGGYYEARTFIEGDSANVSGTQAVIALTSSQGPVRFDGLQRDGGNHKGFDHSILVNDARLVNVDYSPSARTDDMQSYGFRLDVSSGASKGGCEAVHLRGQFGGLGPGGAVYISNASASIGCSDISLDIHSTNATGPVVKFETTGSGTITHAHVRSLDADDYNPSDANQDIVIFDGDITGFSADNINIGYKAGASFTARRVVYDNTGATKLGLIGPNIYGVANTAVVTRTNAGTTAGRHNWLRTDGTPVGAWSSATDRLFGRDTASAGPAEEITVGGGIEFTGSGGIQRSALTGDVTASAGSNSTTIANDAVTYAKMQNVSAQYRVLGRSSSGAGDVEEITTSSAGISFLNAATAAAQAALLFPNGVAQVFGGKLTGANMNSTGDQAITISLPAGFTRWRLNNIFVMNASISLTTAVGGLYTATSKGGTTIIANTQTYSALTGAADNSTGGFHALTNIAAVTATIFNLSTIYLSLTTPQGATATADFYVSVTPFP